MDSRQFHRQLLLTSLGGGHSAEADAPPPTAAAAGSAAALALIRRGQYLHALGAALRELDVASRCPVQPPESPADWVEGAAAAAAAVLAADPSLASEQGRALVAAAVASLYAFIQANLTGPPLAAPESPLELAALSPGDDAALAAAAAAGARELEIGRDSMSPADRWACSQLAENGEDLVGRIRLPQYLALPLRLLGAAPAGDSAALPPEWHWWAMRAVLTQQRVLAGRSAALRARLEAATAVVLAAFPPPPLQAADSASCEARELAGAALLEAALMETAYGRAAEAKTATDAAAAAMGLHAELGGALGVRTLHQQDPRAQLILRVAVEAPEAAGGGGGDLDAGIDGAELDAFLMEAAGAGEEVKGLADESDVLRHPKLMEVGEEGAGAGAAAPPRLSALQQAAVLALAVHAKKGSSADGLQPWEVFAHVDAVLQQRRSPFMARAAAHLQVSRVERTRSRTRERALLGLEGLAEALEREGGGGAGAPGVADRVAGAFAVWFPLRVSLRKELGEAFVALGIVGAALPLFESLELWDNLIVCYRLLDKRVAAEQLVLRRLEATPDDPRLWCALGDLSLDDKHYLEAWERSGRRSARSARSLARNSVRGERFPEAAGWWETALALNPLHPEGWFHLGWCCIKTKDYPRALRALTRAAQGDPDNGEAWNNLAAVHMQLEHWREAYAALTEAVKHNRGSWQVWDNLGGVAARVGEWQAAARAVGTVVALSQGQRLDLAVLGQLVDQVERVRRGEALSGSEGDGAGWDVAGGAGAAAGGEAEGEDGFAEDVEAEAALAAALAAAAVGPGGGGSALAAEEAAAAARQAATFLKAVGNLMKQVAGSAAGGSAFWGHYARYRTALGEPEAALECLLKRVRALQGGAWRENEADFAEYAAACGDLCRGYLAAGGPRELSQARMLLRGAVKQAAERYEGHEGYGALLALVAEVDAASAAAREAAAAAAQP